MTLASGIRLGSYEVRTLLGAGGMGEVYRALDARLGREVAIKLLPPEVAEDAERLARFRREAQVLAALNHPSIAAIYGFEDVDGRPFLVLELVEGEELSVRIAKGALPFDEALPIAKGIAEALEAAHEKGIVHRDLKPANVKVTPDGRVKVLDFGLAKAWASEGDEKSATELTRSPTLTARATQAGVILGTAAYMSPEQARGKPVDKRADIWAFGVVLFEMLTGRRLFDGETISDVLASVLKTEPDLSLVPAETPAALRSLLRRCLQRDPRQRLHDAADLRIELEESGGEEARNERAAPAAPRRASLGWAAAAAAVLGAAAAVAILATRKPAQPPSAPTTRFVVVPPAAGHIEDKPAVSPDGRSLAYVLVSTEGVGSLWVHSLDTGDARRLAGTEGAIEPFWSPDGRELGFCARGQLRRIEPSSGIVQTLCAASDIRGAAWTAAGDVLFSPSSSAPLLRVPAAGGTPAPVTALRGGEQSHRYPTVLPDGLHFLFYIHSQSAAKGIQWASLGSHEPRTLLPDASSVSYDARGYLLFERQQTLLAQRFDASKGALSGAPIAVAANVGSDPEKAAKIWFSAASGTIAYRSGAAHERQLVWMDRSGRVVGKVASPGRYAEPALSPDGERVVVGSQDEAGVDILWVFDTKSTDRRNRVTFGDSANSGVFTPDGKSLLAARAHEGKDRIARFPIAGGPEETIFESSGPTWPDDCSSKFAVIEGAVPGKSFDLFLVPLDGSRKAIPFATSPASETHAVFSPDGGHVAFVSDESGGPEVYVDAVPPTGSPWQVSTRGGDLPVFRKDGKELYYLAADRRLMAVPILSTAPFRTGEPAALFPMPVSFMGVTGNHAVFAASADGQRFLVNAITGPENEPGIRVILNWHP